MSTGCSHPLASAINPILDDGVLTYHCTVCGHLNAVRREDIDKDAADVNEAEHYERVWQRVSS